MKWTFFISLVLVFILFFGFAWAGERKEEKTIHWLRFEMSFAYRWNPGYTFSRLPLGVRAVPLHPDDDWLKDYEFATSPLPDRKVNFRHPARIDLGFVWHPIDYFALGIVYTDYEKDNLWPNDRYQQNQYGNSEVGGGMSLRWYEVNVFNTQFGLNGFLATPWFSLPRGFKSRFKVGGYYPFWPLKLNVRSGYDRFGHDEVWLRRVLGEIEERRIYVAYDIGFSLSEKGDNLDMFYLQLMYFHTFERFTLKDDFKGVITGKENHPNFAIGLGISFGQ